jgi:hypothetical protein
MWALLTEWGQRLAILTGLATPLYGGMVYLKLNPVTESYVTAKIDDVKKDINGVRIDTLDTKRTVLTLARNAFAREQEQLETALATEKNSITITLFKSRLNVVKDEISKIDRRSAALDERIEGMRHE